MSKFSKIIILCGVVLIGFSIILSAFNFNRIFTPFTTGDKASYTQTTKIIGNTELENLKITTRNERITIKPTTRTEIRITYYESDRNKYSFSETDDTFTMTKDSNIRNFRIGINFSIFIPYIVVEIPETLILSYDIKTSNARIQLNDLNLRESTFTSSNGRIEVENIVSTANLKFQTSNSSINVENLNAGKVYFGTTNGSINLDNIKALVIDGKTSNSSITLDRITSQELLLKTSNGRINLKNINSHIINAQTSNSSIEANIIGFENDFKRDLRTSNGRIRINDIEYGTRVLDNQTKSKQLILHTSNGGVRVKF